MILHNQPMDPWTRIEAELKRRNKDWKWLGAEIGFKPARMGNWRERGIPASAYVAIADALDQSVDWMLGREGVAESKPDKSKNETTLARTLADLAGHLKSMDPDIQRKAMLLISDLVADPDSHATVAAMIELSIRSKNRKAA